MFQTHDKKNTFTKRELSRLSAGDIIEKLKYENYSLLDSFGAWHLRTEMIPVGKVCNLAINYFFMTTGPKGNKEKHTKAARAKLVKTLNRIAPGSYAGVPHDQDNGLVVGFNHPSLGEIARIMAMKVDLMGDKPMYFPVNLPWYEALAPNFDNIQRLGIIITPTITPSTFHKLGFKKSSRLYKYADRIKREFRDIYTNLSREAMKNGGVIFVAPSATRQATVFKDIAVYHKTEPIIPTMSLLATTLYTDPKVKCDFLPLAVLPPADYNRGLNLNKKYRLIPGKIMSAKYIRDTYIEPQLQKDGSMPHRLENFDWDFHKRIADELPREFWY